MMTEKELAYERQIPIKGNEALRLKAFEYCEGYKDFIDNAKTEREAVEYTKNIAESNGFLPLQPALSAAARNCIMLTTVNLFFTPE